MQDWGEWAMPIDEATAVGTREDALQQWLLRRILASDSRKEAFLSKEQIALLLVASGIAATPHEPPDDRSGKRGPDDGPMDPSVGGRDAVDVAPDMVRYDLEVLLGAAKQKSARRSRKSAMGSRGRKTSPQPGPKCVDKGLDGQSRGGESRKARGRTARPPHSD
jgi:hypothetical protein